MRLKLIYNPAAGRGRARRHVGEAAEYLRGRGAIVELAESASPADLTRIAAESSRDSYDRVVVCGGDGTLNLGVRHFDLQRGTLALLPLGSGDDFARVSGIPRDVRKACDVVLDGTVREIDVATANGLRFLGVAGLGFDSEVARYANEEVRYLRGSAVYLYAILRVLPRFTPHKVRINGREEEIMFAVFGNTPQYGGGIRIAPAAQINDGLLEVCIVHRTSRFQLLKTLPLAYSGRHVNSPFVELRHGAQFNVESERPMDVYADGERLTTTPVQFGFMGHKLRMVMP
ncbi:MAG TPA: diacylglycerol kinase family protein [Thermoanaerobaculia bacterium]|nr:diacylglycerol kinase family protein [Thermoanaerobaculia bacterium]